MKTSMFLAGASAMMVAAGPINKRAMETQWVYELVTVTVTEDDVVAAAAATAPAGGVFVEKPAPVVYATTTVLPEAPKQQPPVVYLTTTIPAVVPKPTQAAPVPEPVVEKPKEEPKKEEPKKEEPKQEAPKQEAPKQEESKPVGVSGDYKSVILNQHNIHRSNHSAAALEWDDTLATYAKTTAGGCVFEHDMNQGTGKYGQNLAFWASSNLGDDAENKSAAQGITNMWYNDEMNNWAFYGQPNPPSNLAIDAYGHFTQVVWKGTQKVGCATIRCPAGTLSGSLESLYTVCNYSPQGNFGGEYGDNVLSPKGDKRVVI